ncbi:MAG: SRPBCC domain-containing protein [Verrucomicrobia bacterium]|nr:SRPBCC domain-containing protein [Verrucomicrobiota bacterium]
MQAKPFVISREFAAPRDLVWKVWTEREHFANWFGPKGITVTLAKFDLSPGGMCHYSMQTPDGKLVWGKAVYREIVPPTKLVWINSFSDKDAGITRHPFTKDSWPLQMLTVVTFAENAGKTTVTVTWWPYNSDADERQVFNNNLENMKGGWGGTFDQLETYLAHSC